MTMSTDPTAPALDETALAELLAHIDNPYACYDANHRRLAAALRSAWAERDQAQAERADANTMIGSLGSQLAKARAALVRAEETAAQARRAPWLTNLLNAVTHEVENTACNGDHEGRDGCDHCAWEQLLDAVPHPIRAQAYKALAADTPAAPCPCALANGDPCPVHADAPAAQHIRLLPEIGDDEAFRLYNTYTGADHGEAVISEMADAYIVLCVCEEEFVVESDDDGLIDEAKRDEAMWMLYRHVARIAKAKAADALAAPNVEIERKRAAAARANGVKDCTVSISQGWCPVHGFGTPPVGADAPAASAPEVKPRVVCLCGSTRFSHAFRETNLRETLAGRIVLSIGCDMRSDTELFADLDQAAIERIKAGLDELHKRKIDLADEILVLNVGGYIGESTRSEIAYAQAHGKPIRWLETAAASGSGVDAGPTTGDTSGEEGRA